MKRCQVVENRKYWNTTFVFFKVWCWFFAIAIAGSRINLCDQQKEQIFHLCYLHTRILFFPFLIKLQLCSTNVNNKFYATRLHLRARLFLIQLIRYQTVLILFWIITALLLLAVIVFSLLKLFILAETLFLFGSRSYLRRQPSSSSLFKNSTSEFSICLKCHHFIIMKSMMTWVLAAWSKSWTLFHPRPSTTGGVLLLIPSPLSLIDKVSLKLRLILLKLLHPHVLQEKL